MRDGIKTPFLRGVVLADVLRAAANTEDHGLDGELSEVVRSVVVGLLADGCLEPSVDDVRKRTGRALLEAGLDQVAYRFDPALDPCSFAVDKRDEREPEPYDRDRLKRSVSMASTKILTADEVDATLEEVESEIGATSGEIDTDQIRTMVSEALRRRNDRAFLRYALGGPSLEIGLDGFLDRLSPAPQVRKRDGSVVLFEGEKLAKAIRRAFPPKTRDKRGAEIADFVTSESVRIREKMAVMGQPESTASIGEGVLDWLFDRDEHAWASYWLIFVGPQSGADGAAPAQKLAEAHTEMRERKAPGA